MKILILGAKEYPLLGKQKDIGGIDTYNQSLLNELKDCKIISIVRSCKHSPALEKINNVEVRRVKWVPGFWTKSTTFGFTSFLESLGLDFDIILAHGQIATFFGIFLSKLKKKPLVSIPHGLGSQQEQYGLLKGIGGILEKWALTKPKAVIALCRGEAIRFKQLSLRIKAILIPTGISLSKFRDTGRERIHRELNIKEEQIVLLSTSRFIAVKGLNFLIASLQKLKGNFVLLLAGTGPEEQNLKNQVAQLRLQDKVKFLGFRRDVPDVLAAADIFILPSISEGLPMGLLEAMASGKACVVTDIGLPVENYKTGGVVPAADSDKLTITIQKLIDDKLLRERLGNSAFNYVKDFTWEKTVSKIISLFEKLTKGKA